MQIGFYFIWVGASPTSRPHAHGAGLGLTAVLFFVVLLRAIYRRRDNSGYSLMDRYRPIGEVPGEGGTGGGGED